MASLQPAPTSRDLYLSRSAARVLAACANSRRLCVDLPLADPLAERVFAHLGGDAACFHPAELRCTALRAFVVDRLVRDFFRRNPSGVAVGVHSTLGTRAHRLAACALNQATHSASERRWVDVDVPEVAKLRRHLLPNAHGWLQMAAELSESSWVRAVCESKPRPLLFVLDESALPLQGHDLGSFLDNVSLCAKPGAELILAFDASLPLRRAPALQRAAMLELVLERVDGVETLARYPRLRFVDEDDYPEELRTSVAGVNAIARLHAGLGAPALVHLRLN